MRAAYFGREIRGRAIWPLVEALVNAGCDARSLPTQENLTRPGVRISWVHLLSILNLAESTFNVEQLRALGARGLTSDYYRARIQFARRLLTLEDAYRFMVYPHEEIDYGCIQAAVDVKPGRVQIIAILASGYTPSAAFFEIMCGAVMALPKRFGISDANVNAKATGRFLSFEISFAEAEGVWARARSRFSNFMRNLYCAANVANVHAELVDRTFSLQRILEGREVAKAELHAERSNQERRMSNMAEVIAEYNELNQVVYLSPNAERLFGYPNTVLLEDPLVILGAQQRAHAQRFFANPVAIPNGIYSVIAHHSRGDPMNLEIGISHFVGDSGERRWLAIIRDVSQRKASALDELHGSDPKGRINAQAANLAAIDAVPELVDTADNQGRTVLLVDDDELARRVSMHILQRAGFAVICAEDALAARAALAKQRVDGLILDVNMPVVRGDELYRALQEEGVSPPVLFVTGDPNAIAQQFPSAPLVAKPFRAAQLIAAVEQMVA